MFDLIGALFYLILEAGMFLVGSILLIYGLYSLTVPKFDESVRIFCLFLGTILIACGIGLHWFSNSDSETENTEFVGNYETTDERKLKIDLSNDGTFIADPSLFVKTTGNWRIVDFDEFYHIEFLTTDNFRLKSLEIVRTNNHIILRTKTDFTNVEDRLELKKL